MNDRKEEWPYTHPSAIIDTTNVRIEQPKEEPWEFFMAKNTYAIKYEIVCSIRVPHIIWISGPWKGLASDPTIVKVSGVMEELGNEALLADKIYRGDPISFICPVTGQYTHLDSEEKSYNYLVYCARQSVEQVIK